MWPKKIPKIPSRSLSHCATSPLIITPQELHNRTTPQTRIVDVTWFMPNVKRSGLEEWKSKRIPGSRYLDLDEVASEHELQLPHMMPSPATFAKHCSSSLVRALLPRFLI
jgi:thiosulfate/3-mercaptopyruvate sulfurtransferase